MGNSDRVLGDLQQSKEKSLIRKKEIEEKEAAKAAVEPARGKEMIGKSQNCPSHSKKSHCQDG